MASGVVQHSGQGTGEIHFVHNFTYDSLLAMEAASSLVAGDVGKVAKVSDDQGLIWYYVLINHTGPVWGPLNEEQYGTGQTVDTATDDVITIPLGDEQTYFLIATAVFQLNGDASDHGIITKSGLFYRTGGGGATQQDASVSGDENTVSAGISTADFSFQTSSNSVIVRVAGVASTTIDWKVWLKIRKAF